MPIGIGGAMALGGAQQLLGIGLNQMGNQQQMQQQQQLMQQQYQNQQALNLQGQQIQQQNWNYTNYGNQVKHMENAGLNVGLMYGMGGGGGQSMGTGGGGGAASGNAPQNTNPQIMGIAADTALKAAQVELTKAQADKLKSDTPTSGNTGNMLVENMKQSGISQWWDNLVKRYTIEGSPGKDEHGNDIIEVYRNAVYNIGGSVGDGALKIQQLNADLFKTEAEKKNLDANAILTNEKAKGYWNELMNETAKANAAGVQAAAIKLASEWNTGEFTNWKTWTELAKGAIQSAGSLIKGSKEVNINNPRTINY